MRPELLRVDRDGRTWWHGFGLKAGNVVEYRVETPDHIAAILATAHFRDQHPGIDWLNPDDPRLHA